MEQVYEMDGLRVVDLTKTLDPNRDAALLAVAL